MFRTLNNMLDIYSGTISDTIQFDFCGKAGYLLTCKGKILGNPFAGPAFYCYGNIVENESEIVDYIRIDMLSSMAPGCVQTILNCPDNIAVYGDISASLAQQAGAIGCVMEGPTRDFEALSSMKFPIYYHGLCPYDAYGKWQIENYTQSDDWVFADHDGVFIVYANYVEDVIDIALSRSKNESKIRAELFNGTSPSALYKEYGRW